MTFAPNQLLIVGAGFSMNAGLPLASQFTRRLLDVDDVVIDGPSNGQIRFLQSFVNEIFGEGAVRSPDDWPELEDIFTLVDLAANTGHHLGKGFSAAKLRVVRRALLVRTIRMLAQRYRKAQAAPDAAWGRLEEIFKGFDLSSTAVLSMNWDTVFEAGIRRAQRVQSVDYGIDAKRRKFSGRRLITPLSPRSATPLHILKPHGSVNWLYCDACRETFWVPPSDYDHVAQTLFRARDWAAIAEHTTLAKKQPVVLEPPCPHCSSNALGTRFATFSYRKALDFPMHARSWKAAEVYLKASSDWVFFGYSMPAADFEFKHLLKRVQLTEDIRPTITVITGGDDAGATVARFQRFFGEVPGERFFFENGLTPQVLRHLRSRKILRPA